MLEELMERLESVTATVISGVTLAISLILSLTGVNVPIYLDLAWIAFCLSGIPLFYGAVRKLIRNKGISKISSALLISVAMIASIAIGDLFAAGEIAFIMAIGEILEDKTTARARKGLKNLISLTPTKARRVENGKCIEVSAEEIAVDDILRILPGEAVPVDGVILSGETSIDQSVVTGESLPVDKSVGDNVFCGTINRFGAIDIVATKVGSDSSLSKLINMVKEAEDKKAPMQRIADKWASWLVPVAMILAIVSGLLKQDISVAVTMLVVFCPCALVLATPTAIMAAIGQATKHGVIIKSGEALEKMGKVDTVCFDKTGTLTFGKVKVSDVVLFDTKISNDEFLSLVASAESKSEHPLGQAIVAEAIQRGIKLKSTDNFCMEAGKGVYSEIDGKKLFLGNEKYLIQSGVGSFGENKQIETFKNQGKALVFAAVDGKCIGVIALSDSLKPASPQMVKELTKNGTDAVLLTGDNKEAAHFFASQVGIEHIRAELLPEQKVQSIENLQQQGRKVCMIGDGVNDAPALKTADVGVAMGTMGSDIAITASDIALIGDDISKIPYLKRLSNATLKTIKFSISLSLLINLLAIVLSYFELLNPTTGAIVHNIGSVFVVLIAALLYDRKF